MAKKYVLSADRSLSVSEVAAAIADYYAAEDYTIHYSDETNIIFSIPSIFDKVIRIWFGSSNAFRAYFGDAWTSGTTMTNTVTIADYYSESFTNVQYLILDTKFVFLLTGNYERPILFGRISNGESIAFSTINLYSTANRHNNHYTYRIKSGTTNERAYYISKRYESDVVTDVGNFLIKEKCHFLDASGKLILDSFGAPVYLENLYISPLTTQNSVLSNEIFTYCLTHYYNGYITYGAARFAFLFELETA